MSAFASVALAAALLQPAPAPEATADPVEVTVSDLSGGETTGMLRKLDAKGVTVEVEGIDETVPVDEILQIEFPEPTGVLPESRTTRLALTDGVELAVTAVQTDKANLAVTIEEGRSFDVPLGGVRSIRFAIPAGETEAKWNELLEREFTSDALVVQRDGGVLDFVGGGTVASIGPEKVTFLLGGNELPVKREKLFGLIFARPQSNAVPLCVAKLKGNQTVPAQSVSYEDGAFTIETASGADLSIAPATVASLDYSQSKIQFLSAMEPKSVDTVYNLDQARFPAWFGWNRDRTGDGQPLTIGRRTFRRGLWIHSQNTIVYRLNGDYRQFTAVAGIAENLDGDVLLKISADDEVLFEKRVTGDDDPIPLDLDVTDARDLTIFVGFGVPFQDACDHLVLGDAKVIK